MEWKLLHDVPIEDILTWIEILPTDVKDAIRRNDWGYVWDNNYMELVHESFANGPDGDSWIYFGPSITGIAVSRELGEGGE